MIRNQEEIAARLKIKLGEFLNFESDVLLCYLDFEHAKPYLREGVTPGEWSTPLDENQLLTDMREYMEFAIGKTEDHRSLSAGRSINKMCAYLFLLGDDDMLAFAENDDHYKQYGAPILRTIAVKYFPDMEHSTQFHRMADGLPCRPDCEEGCST